MHPNLLPPRCPRFPPSPLAYPSTVVPSSLPLSSGREDPVAPTLTSVSISHTISHRYRLPCSPSTKAVAAIAAGSADIAPPPCLLRNSLNSENSIIEHCFPSSFRKSLGFDLIFLLRKISTGIPSSARVFSVGLEPSQDCGFR